MTNSIALSVVMMPRDANAYGSIFGGIILSYIDQAGFIESRKHGVHRWVTASMNKVDFERPVYIGDVVRFYTKTIKKGMKSVEVQVTVIAERFDTNEQIKVTTAELTMVSIDANGKTIPFSNSPTTYESEQ